MVGFLHSIESMGLVDGPGIRSVVFLSGCALRCRYCHNPDTWDETCGEEISPDALVRRLLRFKPYFDRSGGGVTFSGGEPLLEREFLLETLRLCHENDIATCLDTAGVGTGGYDEILRHTDLILYDVKHWAAAEYHALTGRDPTETNRFIEAVRTAGTPMWVRHVVVPGISDSEDAMRALRAFVQTLPNVQKVELLPYHLLGVNKYEALGLPYSLAGVPAMDADLTKKWQREFFEEDKV